MSYFITYLIVGILVGFVFGWLFQEKGFILLFLSTLATLGALIGGFVSLYLFQLPLLSYFIAVLGACLVVLVGLNYLIKQVNKPDE